MKATVFLVGALALFCAGVNFGIGNVILSTVAGLAGATMLLMAIDL